MQLLNKLKQKINYLNKWYNPYYYWLPFKKYIKRPTMSFYITHKYNYFFGLPCYDSFHCIFRPLGWKLKYDMARWEWNPYFSLRIPYIGHFLILWGFENTTKVKNAYMLNSICWESILDLTLADKITKENIIQTFNDVCWTTHSKNGKHTTHVTDLLKNE